MYDYHTHTSFSADSRSSIEIMLNTATQLGLKEYAITDHYDPDYPDDSIDFNLDQPAYHKALLEAEDTYKNKLKVIKGIELGIQHGRTAIECQNAVKSFPYDFVIGSFHCFKGVDTYTANYEAMDPTKIISDFYEYCLSTLDEFLDFSVLGHINVIDRYIGNIPYFQEEGVPYYMSKNFNKEYRNAEDIISEILKKLIKNNIGIEVNTSYIRYNLLPRTVPSKEILSLYKDLGGNIITFGSDAHRETQICEGFVGAKDYVRSLGFTHQATFHNRELRLVTI